MGVGPSCEAFREIYGENNWLGQWEEVQGDRGDVKFFLGFETNEALSCVRREEGKDRQEGRGERSTRGNRVRVSPVFRAIARGRGGES